MFTLIGILLGVGSYSNKSEIESININNQISIEEIEDKLQEQNLLLKNYLNVKETLKKDEYYELRIKEINENLININKNLNDVLEEIKRTKYYNGTQE